MKITKDLHISFDFENAQGNKSSIFIEYIDKRRFDAVSLVLGKVYEKIINNKIHPDVFVIDWSIILGEDLEKIEPFFEHLFSTAEIITNNSLIVFNQPKKALNKQLEENYIDDEIINSIKGLMLFICALLRYTTQNSMKNVEGLFFTHNSVSDWRSSHTYSTESQVEKKSSLEKI